MTTKHSTLRVLKSQADLIAQTIMAAERGEPVSAQFAEKVAQARNRPSVKIGIAMDDKVITIDIPWERIKSSGEVALAEWILDLMREKQNTAH